MEILQYINSLTASDARAGQGAKVKIGKNTTGYTVIVGTGAFSHSSLRKAGEAIGILQEVGTVVKSGQRSTYAKVLLSDPYIIDIDGTSNILISYLWFPVTDLVFAETTSEGKPVVVTPAVNSKTLEALYCNAPGGVNLRSSATTASAKNIIRLVSYGDIVGFTDNTTKTYLTIKFYKVFDAQGKEIGWVASDDKYVSKNKPQAKGLPKIDEKGGTILSYGDVSASQDPQNANGSSSVSWGAIILWGGLFLVFGGLILLFKPKQPKDGTGTRA